MVEKKRVVKVYDVEIWPKETWTTPMKDLILIRKRNGLSTKEFDHCFCCGREFRENEIPRAGTVCGIGNRFFCKSCAETDKGKEIVV